MPNLRDMMTERDVIELLRRNYLDVHGEKEDIAQRLLALNMRIWAYAPPALQSSLLEMHHDACSASPALYRRSVSVSHVLDLCRLCYWVAEPEPGALPEEVTRGGALCPRPTESIRPLRRSDLIRF